MASITYEVTDAAIASERLGTIQTKILKLVERFDRPTVQRVGTYTSAMDHNSGKGTLVAKYETFAIEIVFDDSDAAEIDEMLYSLMDYQVATLNGADIPKLLTDRNFVMVKDSWSFPSVGCVSNRLAFSGKFQN